MRCRRLHHSFGNLLCGCTTTFKYLDAEQETTLIPFPVAVKLAEAIKPINYYTKNNTQIFWQCDGANCLFFK